jgi:two-component system chemotaxis sensor kinase CheA
MDPFEKELKLGFLEEASQLLTDTEQCFLTLESSPGDSTLLDKIFRLAHNLKGSSKAVGFDELGAFTHELESLLLCLKNGEIQVQADVVSLLLRCNDHIRMMLGTLKEDLSAHIDSSELIADIQALRSGNSKPAAEPPVQKTAPLPAVPGPEAESEPAPPMPEEGASPEQVFDLIASETEKHLKQAAPPPSPGKPAAAADESIRVSLGRLERLINFVGELVILQTVLREQAMGSNPHLLRKTVHQMGKVTKEVQDISMGLRMVPVKQTFQKMQRIVRDTSSALDKKVQLSFVGEETELDKTVLENLSDPLVHLIRNAVDHGIESSEDRLKKGKPETGKLLLQAFHQSDKLVIEVIDDGAGIDGNRLKAKAIEKGLLPPNASLSEKDAIQLIFHPGFSTKEKVTEVSGRGVGMDVVKTNIEQLQGEVQVETELGKGTTFRVVLPLTLAIIDGMIVKSNDDRFVVPLAHVHESLRPVQGDIHPVTGIGNVLSLRGETLPLYSLETMLGKPDSKKHPWDCIALVVRGHRSPFAVLVDDILGQHQVVIKKLGAEIQNLKGFSGSAILGDGRPSLILELPELISKPKAGSASGAKPEMTRRAAA